MLAQVQTKSKNEQKDVINFDFSIYKYDRPKDYF